MAHFFCKKMCVIQKQLVNSHKTRKLQLFSVKVGKNEGVVSLFVVTQKKEEDNI